MRKILAATMLGAAMFGILAAPAHAAFMPTTASFFTAPADGTLTFTFEGYSAADTDTMFDFNGHTIFTNQTTPVGTVVSEAVTAGQLYQLRLVNSDLGAIWDSDPALNSDHLAHLASTPTFADFNLGTAPVVVNTNCAIPGGCYLGWEDLPPTSDRDFNDLVFALQFTAVPEPASLVLLGTALFGMGIIRRRRS